jgi:molybdopterin/thiamine biosynthesis adenylyltransferase
VDALSVAPGIRIDPYAPLCTSLQEIVMTPRLKSLTCLAGEDALLVSLDPRTRVELADPTGQVLALLRLLVDGTRTPSELCDVLALDWPAVTQPDVDDALTLLDGLGWLEDATAPALLDAYQRERYASNLAFFDAFTTLQRPREAFQFRLLRAHVVLLGAGGLGSSVLQNLAGLGVGRVTVLDFDCVELKNLARQFTYSEAQLGLLKVEQVAAWARDFSARMRVTAIKARVSAVEDLVPLLSDADLVVAAIDQPDSIDLIVNEACVRCRVPFIRGGLAYTQGLYWSVDPGRSACRLCLETYRASLRQGVDAVLDSWPMVLRADLTNRATGPIAQMLGALVSMEVLRYLTGLVPPVSAGAYQLVDFASDCAISTDRWPRDPHCPVCSAVATSMAAPGVVTRAS